MGPPPLCTASAVHHACRGETPPAARRSRGSGGHEPGNAVSPGGYRNAAPGGPDRVPVRRRELRNSPLHPVLLRMRAFVRALEQLRLLREERDVGRLAAPGCSSILMGSPVAPATPIRKVPPDRDRGPDELGRTALSSPSAPPQS